jgi:hypothetical protein
VDEACRSFLRDENMLRILDENTPEKTNTSGNVSTICTICCNNPNLRILPTRCFYLFLKFSQSLSTVSIRRINRFLLYVMEAEFVLSEVRTDPSYTIHINFNIQLYQRINNVKSGFESLR